VEAGPSIRKFVVDHGAGDPELRNAYDEAVKLVERFRAKHLEYAAAYIHRQSQRGANSTSTGTGGTPFLTYLDKHRRETAEHVLPRS
jgi:indoleamine 2,3-dioxygenase